MQQKRQVKQWGIHQANYNKWKLTEAFLMKQHVLYHLQKYKHNFEWVECKADSTLSCPPHRLRKILRDGYQADTQTHSASL